MGSFLKEIGPVGFLFVTTFVAYTGLIVITPFTPDILLDGLCPGQTECTLVISVVGAQKLAIGIITFVLAPFLGGLSDDYGRKPIFLSCLLVGIVAPGVLAYSRSGAAIYNWVIFGSVSTIALDAGYVPALLASVADVVNEEHRSSAVGWAMGSASAAFFAGTLAALGLTSINQAIWASLILRALSAILMKFGVKETNPRQPLLPANDSQSEKSVKLLPKSKSSLKVQRSNLRETAKTVWASWSLIIISLVDFFNTFALASVDGFTLYYLKKRFGFGKNEFSTLFLLSGGTAVLGMTTIYPVLAKFMGDRAVLWLGLVVGSMHYSLYGFAFATWVPYLAASTELLQCVTRPALGAMVSKAVDRDSQGKIQGFMSAVRAASYVLAPLTITPLTIAALGDNPPFGMMGLPLAICGFIMLLALFISLWLPPLPSKEPSNEPTDNILAPALEAAPLLEPVPPLLESVT